jgi:hypothetical protein
MLSGEATNTNFIVSNPGSTPHEAEQDNHYITSTVKIFTTWLMSNKILQTTLQFLLWTICFCTKLIG